MLDNYLLTREDQNMNNEEIITKDLYDSTKTFTSMRNNGILDKEQYNTLISYSISCFIERKVDNTINNYLKNKFYETFRRLLINGW